MYNVHSTVTHKLSVFDHVKVAETKINDTLIKTPWGSLGGSRTTLWVPQRAQIPRWAQGKPCKALPMRSLEKRKKGMGYENACRDLRSLGTHFHIPYLSYVFRGNALL